MELPKGIYFEYAPATNSSGPGNHAYLVFHDGKGGEQVIRGGLPENEASFPFGGNITVQADIPLRNSEDAYKEGDTPQTRHARKLDLGGCDPATVWKNMAAKAREIGKAGIDYNIFKE